jgi:Ca2+/Na+ antiporter
MNIKIHNVLYAIVVILLIVAILIFALVDADYKPWGVVPLIVGIFVAYFAYKKRNEYNDALEQAKMFDNARRTRHLN